MSGISTDVIALAAILGSAAVGGVATLALAGEGSEDFSYECATTVVETAPRVVVSMGSNAGAIVVAPDVSVSTRETCSNVVTVNTRHLERVQVEMDRARAQADRARERAERTRDRAERIRVERIHELDGDLKLRTIDLDGLKLELAGLEGLLELEGLDALLEAELDGLDELLELEIEGRLDAELRELEEQLARIERGNGR